MKRIESIHRQILFPAIFALAAACSNGGNGSNSDTTVSGLDSPVLSVTGEGTKKLDFSWAKVEGATLYRLFANPDGASGFSQIGADIDAASSAVSVEMPVHLTDWINAQYMLETCDADGCVDSTPIGITNLMLNSIGYVKASNTGTADKFGSSVALSKAGKTIAIGAPYEDSNTQAINGDQSNNDAIDSGAVYVFSNNGISWSQQAYIKASNADTYDLFGSSLAISADGNTLAVGAQDADAKAGKVYVFTRSGELWSQQASLQHAHAESKDLFGASIAISDNGNTLAVGAYAEDGAAIGVNGTEGTNTKGGSGAVYVYLRNTGVWSQQAYIKASNTDFSDIFGRAVALSGDGDTLAVGAPYEDSNASGINGDQVNNDGDDAGAVYVFTRENNIWNQQSYIKASNNDDVDIRDYFGWSLALNEDGNLLLIGATGEDSKSTGVNGGQDLFGFDSGAAYLFRRNSGSWSEEAFIKASNTEGSDPSAPRVLANDRFGFAVSISSDGLTLAIGAYSEDSSASGINGQQGNAIPDADHGAVYVYTQEGGLWSQRSYVKADNTGKRDYFGYAVSLSADGNSMIIGATGEDSDATGIDGDGSIDMIFDSGAVYLY